MRHFRLEEQQFIRDLSVKKQEGNLQDLQVFQLLRPQLSNIALRWDVVPKKNIQIYFPSGFASGFTNQIMKAYYDIVDFIYFIEELEKYNLIKIQSISFSNRRLTHPRCLYDNITYNYDGSEDVFKYSDGGTIGLIYIRNKETDNDFVEELEKYVNAYIFPLPALDEFIAYGFKDFDQRIFDENIETNHRALEYSRKAIIQTERSIKQTSCSIKISFIALLLSAIAVVVPLLCNNDAKRIESAILQKKTITIDSFTNCHLDTVKVNVINELQVQPINMKAVVPSKQSNPNNK